MENDSITLMGVCDLSDDTLAEAFKILYHPTWKSNWTNKQKAKEMRSIIRGDTLVCQPFSNYAECVDFLARKCAREK